MMERSCTIPVNARASGPGGARVYIATADQARLLIEGVMCKPVRNRSGLIRYLQMRTAPPVKCFCSISAQANFTISQTANLYEHQGSKRKGL